MAGSTAKRLTPDSTSTTTSPKQRVDAPSAGPQLGELKMVPVHLIDASYRLRAVDPAKAAALAERFRTEPMRSPALLSGPNEDGLYRLRFGAHRFEAHLINEASEMLCLVVPEGAALDDDDFRLMEIAENVERFELIALDRAVAVAEWRRIFEVRNGKVKSGPRKKAISAPNALTTDGAIDEAANAFSGSFSEEAQRAFGLSRRAIFDDLKIATIDEGARGMIAFLPVANSKSELLQLAGQSAKRQWAIAQLIYDNPALSISEALASIDHLPAPKRPAPVDKVINSFAALKRADQFAFFEMHRAAIQKWLAETGR